MPRRAREVSVRDWADALLAVLLAPLCAACHEPLAQPTRGCVCNACWDAIVRTPSPVCARCGAPLPGDNQPFSGACSCGAGTSAVTIARAVGPYEGALRAIVHALKYDGRRSIARRLSHLMAECATEILAGANAAVPVPLHRTRHRQRGFNQAHDLARHLGLPVRHALRRVRHTNVQATLHASERWSNVEGAFTVTRRAAALQGAVVVLVDDVRTTGATLEACARALRRAGIAEVRVLTAARVAPPSA